MQRDKAESLQANLTESKSELDLVKRDLQTKKQSEEEHESELAELRREIDMREISIKLHDQRTRVLKDETTTLRM